MAVAGLCTDLIFEKLTWRPSSLTVALLSSTNARSERYMPRYGQHGRPHLCAHAHVHASPSPSPSPSCLQLPPPRRAAQVARRACGLRLWLWRCIPTPMTANARARARAPCNLSTIERWAQTSTRRWSRAQIPSRQPLASSSTLRLRLRLRRCRAIARAHVNARLVQEPLIESTRTLRRRQRRECDKRTCAIPRGAP